jgi:outer membrane murein-binding lipoprotein Lpp
MKKRIFIVAVIGFITGVILTGCEKTKEQKVKDAKETLAGAQEDLNNAQSRFLAEWQAFKDDSEQKIEANQKRIEAFKTKMGKMGAKVKGKYDKEVADLEQRNLQLRDKLADFKDDGKSKWKEFKKNFNNDMDAIGKTMTDLFKDQS